MPLFTAPPAPRLARLVAPHRETLAQRLARAATPADRRVRSLLEAWFLRLPEAAQTDVRSRLWERDRRLALAAFWELYLHELLLTLGYETTPHPVLAAAGPRPDFLAVRQGESLYVEALVHGPPTEAWRAERRLYPILDVLHEFACSGWFLTLGRVECGHSTPPLRDLRLAIGEWLESLPPEQEEARLEWRRNGWTVELRATRSLPTPASDVFPLQPAPAMSLRTLASKLQAKAKRYRSLDYPLLLALCISRPLAEETLTESLPRIVVGLPSWVMGVLVASGLDPWAIATTPLRLIRRGDAPLPTTGFFAALERIGARQLTPELMEIDEPWRIFNLWPHWPADPLAEEECR
uniref:Uncharacterized protein n=1 Tax=Thermomicrobium roseum TaxID=500 RepID=A0A7C5VUD5_THERO